MSASCTSLREIPRTDYTVQPDRRDVRVTTRDGLRYEFDYAHFEGDSLVGYRRRDVDGPFDDYAVLRIPLGDVTQLSARSVDWRRTGLLGAAIVAGGVTVGLATRKHATETPSSSTGTKPFIP